jgi:pSer/pThr/pTyr-binding forkhead associated (FHA) protein
MALHSPLTPLEPTTAILTPDATEDDRATAALDPTTLVPRRDALTRLDYRLRRHTVSRGRALPGDYISLENGDGEPELVALKGKVIHVGRASSADLRFEDAHVSRRHAIIVRYGRHVRVLDDRSSAGTFVNGLRVIATDLNDGDVVRLGPIEFTYVVVR